IQIRENKTTSVIITPTTNFHHLQHAEEYRQSPVVGTLVRFLRFAALWTSLFILPLWLLFTMDPSLLPKGLEFIGPNEEGNVPIFIQILIADIGDRKSTRLNSSHVS